MQILDGKALSLKIKEKAKEEVAKLKQDGITPGLAVVLVGDDSASQIYVRMKEKSCEEVGIYSIVHKMPSDISQDRILENINMMNNNPNIDGILVQLPLPPHIDEEKVLGAISPNKDVDGFHPCNVGKLVLGMDCFAPCTPLGVMKLLKEYKLDLLGLDACVVGASNIVGKPMMHLILNEFATVDICHIHTKDLKEHTKRADILFVGVGKVNLITEDMVKEGAIVIDIGINKNEKGETVGDVDFENVSKKCSYITPVPGGVGPMTISTLIENTIKAAKQRKSNAKKDS
jgi:methylenetetrahydrofolate dehydrogenase (NADP+)/methenyltetrahydrofolate cyclohydrolase